MRLLDKSIFSWGEKGNYYGPAPGFHVLHPWFHIPSQPPPGEFFLFPSYRQGAKSPGHLNPSNKGRIHVPSRSTCLPSCCPSSPPCSRFPCCLLWDTVIKAGISALYSIKQVHCIFFNITLPQKINCFYTTIFILFSFTNSTSNSLVNLITLKLPIFREQWIAPHLTSLKHVLAVHNKAFKLFYLGLFIIKRKTEFN